MMKSLALMLVLTIAFGSSHAQQRPGDSGMLRATQPGEHHKQLDSLVGEWEVEIRFRYGAGLEREAKVTSTAKWVLGGRFIEKEYRISGSEFLEYLGYDNHKKKFIGTKMDNMDTGILFTEGAISGDGKTITLTGTRTDPLTGTTGDLRTVIVMTDRDHYTVEWYQTGQNGKEERVVLMNHTRRASPQTKED